MVLSLRLLPPALASIPSIYNSQHGSSCLPEELLASPKTYLLQDTS
ncbi:hypothetical protein E2C01_057025 [Portunus trituberculatus]|uniref:Uncharacterized protein n=1 Tax=Portunus trituberculatus TaxID=210409 RepID=A0A5B7H278_PORTR|nr:hypothetical protein [Portunus trituberculatus]